ncbi:MAG: hypothetical protein GY832_22100 [Chloroflexi bacterium]|nr:hypothetical protein [Chloroflexota bacterium]
MDTLSTEQELLSMHHSVEQLLSKTPEHFAEWERKWLLEAYARFGRIAEDMTSRRIEAALEAKEGDA